MTGTDGGTPTARRSVGGHLAEADRVARRLLGDVGRGRAAAMVRMWPVVVDHAAQLWAALPEQGGADSAMDQLRVMAQGLRETQAGRGWPGAGPDHMGLRQLAASFAGATELLRGQPPSSEAMWGRPPELSNLPGEAARVRVIHTLHVSAHAVGLAVREDLPATARSGSTTGARTASAGEDIAARLLAFEHVAGGYLGHPGRRGPDGQDTPAGGLEGVLASWDVSAHRMLTRHPTPANLFMIARVQAALVVATDTAVHAAAAGGHRDAGAVADRVRPALAEAQRAWSALAGRWQDLLSPATRRPDAGLTATASALYASLSDLVAGRTPARGHVAESGPDAMTVAAVMRHSLGMGVDIAYRIRDVAAQDPDLRGPARVLARRASDEAEHRALRDVGSWVSMRDVHDNRMVPIPGPVRDGLTTAGQTAARAMVTAMSASTALDRHTPAVHGRASTPDIPATREQRPQSVLARPATVPAGGGLGR